jgi:hypothetical protein
MTYVLLFVSNDHQPMFLQGSIEEINTQLRELWADDAIDRDDWEFYSSYNLLCIEDNKLETVNSWESVTVPQFVVD